MMKSPMYFQIYFFVEPGNSSDGFGRIIPLLVNLLQVNGRQLPGEGGENEFTAQTVHEVAVLGDALEPYVQAFSVEDLFELDGQPAGLQAVGYPIQYTGGGIGFEGLLLQIVQMHQHRIVRTLQSDGNILKALAGKPEGKQHGQQK